MSATPRIAVFAGSFDPITLGHTDVLARAAALFDRVVVGVLVNAAKHPMFDLDDRRSMIRHAMQSLELTNVEAEAFDGLLVDFAARKGATVIVRGLRSGADFDYEAQLAGMNRHLAPALDTVFLAASSGRAHISSGLVRDIIAHRGDVTGLVPDAVIDHLNRRRRAATTRQA